MIGSYTYNRKTNLALIWSCGTANEPGNINGNDIYGMSSAFLHTTGLQVINTYSSNWDTSGRCFIGFQYMSMDWSASTYYNGNNYQNFATGFYYYLLIAHASVHDALMMASQDTQNCDFMANTLNTGYTCFYEGQQFFSKMCIYGDVDLTIY